MSELMNYLQYVLHTSRHPITYSGDRANVLNKWLVLKESIGVDADTGINPNIDINFNQLVSPSQQNNQKDWKFYASHHEESSFYLNNAEDMFTNDEDKCIYYLCNVFCTKEQYLISYIWHFNTPMRIWINGQLVNKNTYTFNNHSNLFIYNFKKGNNIVLVERQVYKKYKELGVFCEGFEFSYKPLDYYKNHEPEEIYDESIIKNCYKTYSIIPDRAIYKKGENISFVVIPKNFATNDLEHIKINVYDYKNTNIKTFRATTSRVLLLDIDKDIKGVLRINVQSLGEQLKETDIHIFIGDFIKERNILIKKAQQRNDCSKQLLDTFKKLGKIPALCNSCGELHQEYLYNYLFTKFAEFENYINTKENSMKMGCFDVFKNSALLFSESDIDDGYIAYNVFFPKNYTSNRKYPLVVTMRRGVLLSLLPSSRQYVDKHNFEEAIIVSLPGRGDLNLDYINEVKCFKIIEKIKQELNIDKDKVYFIGECAGATKAYGMALRKPDLFSGLSVMGLPRITNLDYLNNLSNIPIHNICSIDNNRVPNIVSLYMLKDISKAKSWLLSNLSHLELPEMYNNKRIFENILNEKKDKYPKLVYFHTHEPYYNKAYWITVEYFSDIKEKAYIRAEIKSSISIDITTSNIERFSLLLSKEYMGLEQVVDININGCKYSMDIYKNTSVSIILNNDDATIKTTLLNKQEFMEAYEKFEINENLMGIKEAYLKKCVIVKPNILNSADSTKMGDLSYMLQNPLKEFVRNYKYEMLTSDLADKNVLSMSNYVFFNDARNLTPKEEKLFIRNSKILIDTDKICLDKKQFVGDYFAIIKFDNPYNKSKIGLMVVYNSDAMLDKLIKLWESYHVNPIFHSNSLVYNNGIYHCIRENI